MTRATAGIGNDAATTGKSPSPLTCTQPADSAIAIDGESERGNRGLARVFAAALAAQWENRVEW
jgi:hypothetical protein